MPCVLRYGLILECWNFKADLRPSFAKINDRLNVVLAKYENEKLEELQSLMDIKLTTSLVNNNNNIGLSFTKSSSFLLNETPKRFLQMPTPERKSSLSKVRLLIYPSFSPKSESFN